MRAQVLALFVANLWSRFPKTMATFSDDKFKSSQEVQAFVLCVFMVLSPPMPFALMPFLTGALTNAVAGYKGVIAKLPAFARTRLEYLDSAEGQFQVHAFGTVSEVIVTFMGPLLVVVQGYRAALLSFFYFQYVCRRYRSNPSTVQTVSLFVGKVESVCKHRYVPAPAQRGYETIKGAITWAAGKVN